MSTNQVFKFVVVRPPESAAPPNLPGEFPRLRLDRPTTVLSAVERLNGTPQARENAGRLADDFIQSANYVPSSPTAEPYLQAAARIEAAVRRLPEAVEGAQLSAVIEQELDENPGQIAADPNFLSFEESLWDSLYAHLLAPAGRPADRDILIRALRFAYLLKLAADPVNASRPLPVGRLRAEPPLIPPSLFPASSPPEPAEPGAEPPPRS